MTAAIRILGDTDDLLHLETALREEPALLGSRVKHQVRAPQPGEMGPIAEALDWTAANKDLVLGLATALTAWVKVRRTKIRVKVGEDEVIIESAHVRKPEEAAAEILQGLERGPAE